MLVLYRLGEVREFKPGIGNDSQLEPQEVYKRVLAMLELLVDYGADFETSTAGQAPLMQPVLHGNVEIAKFLVEHGANPNEGQQKGPYNQPVYLAFLKWDLDVGRYLQTVAKNPVKPWLVDGLSLLNHAYAGRTDEVQEILARAPKPRRSALANFKAPTGETLLLDLIYESWRADDPIALVRSVLEAGADPNQSGKTENDADIAPLHYAVLKCDTSFLDIEYRINSEFVIKDNLELVALLLEHGANVSSTNCRNLRDYYDNITPLHIAAKLGRVKVARLLIESGAKIMPKDSEGKTPLDLAESGPMIKFLKENGAVEGP